MQERLTDEEWASFEAEGYLRLGRVLADDELEALGERMDGIMLGKADHLDYSKIMMQLDRDPDRDGQPGPQSKGHKGATLAYRKIQDLEYDPLFLGFMQKRLFRDICARAYGEGVPIDCYRAMFMNKPAGLGTELQWHQDRWTELDRDPTITVWTALNEATRANGCVKVVPRTHSVLVNPEHGSGFLSQEQMDDLAAKHEPEYLEVAAGEAVLLHNWVLHSSEVNSTDVPRRAFSACYMDGRTVSSRQKTFSRIFGEGAMMAGEV